MDVGRLARMQSVNRVAMGAGLMTAPHLVARVWSGGAVDAERVKTLARAAGARDLALGAAGVVAVGEGDTVWGRRAFAAQAFAEAVDFVAIVAAGRRLPLSSRLVGGMMAAGSAAVAALYARQLG